MKKFPRWILWLLLAKLTVSHARGEFFILSGPEHDISGWLQSQKIVKDMYCITDELSSALSWNGNLDWRESGNGNAADKSSGELF